MRPTAIKIPVSVRGWQQGIEPMGTHLNIEQSRNRGVAALDSDLYWLDPLLPPAYRKRNFNRKLDTLVQKCGHGGRLLGPIRG
jgi:hypothetical protein